MAEDVAEIQGVVTQSLATHLAGPALQAATEAVTNQLGHLVRRKVQERLGDMVSSDAPSNEPVREHIQVVHIEDEETGSVGRVTLNFGARQAGYDPIVAVPLVELPEEKMSEISSALGLHPAMSTDERQIQTAGLPDSFSLGLDGSLSDLPITADSQLAAAQEMTRDVYMRDIPPLRVALNQALDVWRNDGYQIADQPQSLPSSATGSDMTSESSQSFDTAWTLINDAGVAGALTPSELYDALYAVFSRQDYQAADYEGRLDALPRYLRRALGWSRDSPYLIPLTIQIANWFDDEIRNDAELEFLQGLIPS